MLMSLKRDLGNLEQFCWVLADMQNREYKIQPSQLPAGGQLQCHAALLSIVDYITASGCDVHPSEYWDRGVCVQTLMLIKSDIRKNLIYVL